MANSDCHAIVVQFDSPRYESTVACWLRGQVESSLCDVGSPYDLYTRIPRPLPPTPPVPPPSPPRGPFTPPVQLINEKFRAGRPSDNVNEVCVTLVCRDAGNLQCIGRMRPSEASKLTPPYPRVLCPLSGGCLPASV